MKKNVIFEPIQTLDKNDGNIFNCLDNDEQFFENINFEDNTDISSVFIEKLKSNCDDNNGLMLFNEGTVEVLQKLYESLEKQDVTLDEVRNNSVISSIDGIVGNLKFVQDISRT